MKLRPLATWACGHLFVGKMTFDRPQMSMTKAKEPFGAEEHVRPDRDLKKPS